MTFCEYIIGKVVYRGISRAVMDQGKGTTSTNYGAQFGIYTTALLALRCCQQNKPISFMINNNKYQPWHDLVLQYQDQTVCILTTHESELNKKKFKASLNQRQRLLHEHGQSLVFARLAIAADDGLKNRFPKVDEVPEALSFVLTTDNVYFDKKLSTYFCMEQHDVTALAADIKNALLALIGAQLAKIQKIFLEFIENRFYRLINTDCAMTADEVRKHLAYIILGHYKVPYAKTTGKKQVSTGLARMLKTNTVVLNHRRKSLVKEHIWRFLHLAYPHLRVLTQSALDAAWFSGQLHMPLSSPDEKSDRVILRALEIAGFEPKVLVLRARVFACKLIGTILTIMQGLAVEEVVGLSIGGEEESFRLACLRPSQLVVAATHNDLFSKLARDFGHEMLVEAHDEFHYINDEVVVGEEPLTALIAAVKTPGVVLRTVRDLIKLGANVDSVVIGGHGPLYFAVQMNRLDIAEELLQNGAKPDLADKYGNTPLFYACMEGKAEMVQLLLKHNSDRNAADYYGVPPMFMAYRVKNYEILKILLSGNEKPILADVTGSHILHRAAIDGDVACLKCVLDCVPDINVFMVGNAQGHTPLDIARDCQHEEFVNILENTLK